MVAESRDGIPLRFDVAGGAGRPIVFVHGWSCDRTYWRHQLPWFGGNFRAVAIDLAGHGESGAGRTSWTMPAFGEDVLAVIEALDLDDAVLVGHSMGGDVIVEAALRVPDRIAGLVWIDVYGTLGEPMTSEEVEAFAEPFRSDFVPAALAFVRRMFPPTADPALVEQIAADMAAAPPEVAIDALVHAAGNEGPVIAGLRALSMPVVAINPDDGKTDIEALASHGVKAIAMPDVGHFPMLEAPDAFNRLLEATIATFISASTAG